VISAVFGTWQDQPRCRCGRAERSRWQDPHVRTRACGTLPGEGRNVTCARWQVTLCNPKWEGMWVPITVRLVPNCHNLFTSLTVLYLTKCITKHRNNIFRSLIGPTSLQILQVMLGHTKTFVNNQTKPPTVWKNGMADYASKDYLIKVPFGIRKEHFVTCY